MDGKVQISDAEYELLRSETDRGRYYSKVFQFIKQIRFLSIKMLTPKQRRWYFMIKDYLMQRVG